MTILLLLLFLVLIMLFAWQAWHNGVLVQYWGILGLTGGIGAGYLSFQVLTVVSDKLEGDKPLPGAALVVISLAIGLVVYLIGRGLAKTLLSRWFGEDSPLEDWAFGVSGAALSLLPSFVTILVFASGLRMAGTLMEWRHLESISSSGTAFQGEDIPDWPATARWRNSVEKIPVLSGLLNSLDPISRYSERHIVCLLLVSKNADLLEYLRSEPETAPILKASTVEELIDSQDIAGLLKDRRHVSLINHSLVGRAARDADVSKALKDLELQRMIDAFMISAD